MARKTNQALASSNTRAKKRRLNSDPIPTTTLQSANQYRHPILDPDSKQRVLVGCDFGTDNSSLSYALTTNEADVLVELASITRTVYDNGMNFRFPTLVAARPLTQDQQRATLEFGDSAKKALRDGDIEVEDLIRHSKLGLVKEFDGCFEDDAQLLNESHRWHKRALEKLSDVMFDNCDENVSNDVRKMDDVIALYLKYLKDLLQHDLRNRLQLTQEELQYVFREKVVVGFAAPTIWSDTILDKFHTLIFRAGWPSETRIWSEAKCAMSYDIATVVRGILSLPAAERAVQEHRLRRTLFVLIDAGGATCVGFQVFVEG